MSLARSPRRLKVRSVQPCWRCCLSISDMYPQLLLDHVSEFGPEGSAFTDAAFGNKRQLWPRGGDKPWQKRVNLPSLNPEWHYSFAMCESHTRKLPQSRGKWDKIALEEALGMSQLLVSSCQELQESHPVKDKDLDGKVIAQFLSGDLNFELELQSALSEKEERLSTLRIERHPCLNAGDAGQ